MAQDLKITKDNFLAAAEWVKTNSVSEILNISNMSQGSGLEIVFQDINNKISRVYLHEGKLTPEVSQITKIYLTKI